MWSPMSSSLIASEHEAVLVDTLITFDQVDVLADWAQSHGKRITAIVSRTATPTTGSGWPG